MLDFGKVIIHDSISWNGISDNVHRFLFRMKVNHDENGHVDSFDLKFYKLTPEQEMIMKGHLQKSVDKS